MPKLKEITVRYATKCAKCNRDIKVSWTAYFDPTTKVTYCKYCKDKISTVEATADKNDGMAMFEAMQTLLVLQGDILANIDSQLRDIQKDLTAHDNLLRDMQSKRKASKAS